MFEARLDQGILLKKLLEVRGHRPPRAVKDSCPQFINIAVGHFYQRCSLEGVIALHSTQLAHLHGSMHAVTVHP